MNYTIPEFDTIDALKINSIEIKGLTDTVKLYSDDGVWKFNPDNLKAEPSRIKSMLSFLEKPEFIDMVSDTGNYQNYGLGDGKYIIVTAQTEGNTTNIPDRELFIGDINTNGKFVFIRIPDNKSVFTARGNTKGLFDQSENDLLDKRILDIDTGKIDKIELTFGNTKSILNKTVNSENKDIWETESGLSLETKELEQSIRYLANSKFDFYISDPESDPNSDIFTISLFADNAAHSFTITKKEDENYKGSSTFAGKDFILSGNTGTQIMKMFRDVLTEK